MLFDGNIVVRKLHACLLWAHMYRIDNHNFVSRRFFPVNWAINRMIHVVESILNFVVSSTGELVSSWRHRIDLHLLFVDTHLFHLMRHISHLDVVECFWYRLVFHWVSDFPCGYLVNVSSYFRVLNLAYVEHLLLNPKMIECSKHFLIWLEHDRLQFTFLKLVEVFLIVTANGRLWHRRNKLLLVMDLIRIINDWFHLMRRMVHRSIHPRFICMVLKTQLSTGPYVQWLIHRVSWWSQRYLGNINQSMPHFSAHLGWGFPAQWV